MRQVQLGIFHGYPLWKRVVQYNACYLKKDGDVENSEENCKKLDPVTMWQEPRWIFLRRMFGDEFVQKLFMRCIQWTLVCNDIIKEPLYERQDAIVIHLFGENPKAWFSKYKEDTYMSTWDGRYWGYVLKARIQDLAKRVNIFGPIAGIFGRDLEHDLVTNHRTVKFHLCRLKVQSIIIQDRCTEMILRTNQNQVGQR